jgi:hypothetical protein
MAQPSHDKVFDDIIAQQLWRVPGNLCVMVHYNVYCWHKQWPFYVWFLVLMSQCMWLYPLTSSLLRMLMGAILSSIVCFVVAIIRSIYRPFIEIGYLLLVGYAMEQRQPLFPLVHTLLCWIYRVSDDKPVLDASGHFCYIAHASKDQLILTIGACVWKYTRSTQVISYICMGMQRIRYQRICGDHQVIVRRTRRYDSVEEFTTRDGSGSCTKIRRRHHRVDWRVHGDHPIAPFPIRKNQLWRRDVPAARILLKQWLTDRVHRMLPPDLWHLVLDYFQFLPDFPTEFDLVFAMRIQKRNT